MVIALVIARRTGSPLKHEAKNLGRE